MKIEKIDTSTQSQNQKSNERVQYFFGTITISGEDGEVWYVVNTENASPDDFARMKEDKPVKTPKIINDSNIEEWRMSPRMDSTLADWRKKKGTR
jgi:hypothetical protein